VEALPMPIKLLSAVSWFVGLYWLRFGVISLCSWALILTTAYASFSLSLKQQLHQQLPALVAEAMVNGDDRAALIIHIREQLQGSLAQLTPRSRLGVVSLLKDVQLSNLHFDKLPASSRHAIDLDWQAGKERLYLGFDIQPRFAYGISVAMALLLAAAMLWVLRSLPAPLNQRQRLCRALLLSNGLAAPEVARLQAQLPKNLSEAQLQLLALLVERIKTATHFPSIEQAMVLVADERSRALTPEQQAWLVQAWLMQVRCLRGDVDEVARELDRSYAVALAETSLQFDVKQQTLRVRGLGVQLSKTPFFYYYWYALCRSEGGGWFANPPSNRPDQEAGHKLADLMQAHQGNAKAINELLESGLRSKTLDQNRNKIKEELVAALGETLVEPYLFVSERNARDARSRYRLALEPSQIQC
jgi:hypothetical protein